MKEKAFVIIIIIFLSMYVPFCVKAEEIIDISDFDISNSEKALKNGGYDSIDTKKILNNIFNGNLKDVFLNLVEIIYEKTIGDTEFVYKIIKNLVLIVILSSFFTNFANVFSANSVSEIGFLACYLLTITLMISLFNIFCEIAGGFIELLIEFMYGIVPAYFLAVAIIGQASAAGFYQLTLIVIAVFQFLFLHIVIPLIKIYFAVSVINNISKEDFLSQSANVIKNIINFLIKFFVAMVTGFNIIQGLILPAIDTTKNTAINKIIGSLPIVGDGANAMSGVLLGSVNLMKNTIGTFGIVIILTVCVIPFLKIQLYSFIVQIVSAILQPVSDARIIESFSCMVTGIKMLGKVIVSGALLFVLSIAIICMATN